MPFVAECPYCGVGKVRVPESAVGWSVTCPNPECGSSFTVAPPVKYPTPTAKAVVSAESRPTTPAPPPVAETKPAACEAATDQTAAATTETPEAAVVTADQEVESEAAEETGSAAGGLALRPIIADPWKPTQRPANTPAVLALFFGAFALLFASFPGLYWVSLLLAGVGAVSGLAGILYAVARERGMGLAVVASSLCGLTLVVLLVAPWLVNPQAAQDFEEPADYLPKAASSPTTGKGEARALDETEWVDASTAAIQREDVWVKVASARIERVGLELQGRRVLSDQRYLVVRVQLANNGVLRPIEYVTWREYQTAPGSARVTLRDSAGRTVSPAGFPAGTHLVGAVREARIFPGKSHDDFLVFQLPTGDYAFLDLLLPGQAVGVEGDFRFRLPRSMVGGTP